MSVAGFRRKGGGVGFAGEVPQTVGMIQFPTLIERRYMVFSFLLDFFIKKDCANRSDPVTLPPPNGMER